MDIKNFKNWVQVGDWDGHYRFVIGAKCAYEIFIDYHAHGTPIETAKADLCITGLWGNRDGTTTLEREWLARELPICELLDVADKDNRENNK